MPALKYFATLPAASLAPLAASPATSPVWTTHVARDRSAQQAGEQGTNEHVRKEVRFRLSAHERSFIARHRPAEMYGTLQQNYICRSLDRRDRTGHD